MTVVANTDWCMGIAMIFWHLSDYYVGDIRLTRCKGEVEAVCLWMAMWAGDDSMMCAIYGFG